MNPQNKSGSGIAISSDHTKADFVPEIAIGVSSFKELVLQSTVFVDKSLLIKDFLENNGQTILLTYPRRWGKSINIDMIKAFLEIEVDELGNPLPYEQRQNPKLFFGNGKDLKPLKISETVINRIENGKSVRYEPKDLLGKYPVILLGFKDVSGRDYSDVEKGICSEIRKLYNSHKYLLHSSKLDENDKTTFKRYQAGDVDTEQLKTSVQTLTRLLYEHYNQKVIVLIDEYDTPINSAQINFPQEGFHDQFDRVLLLYRGLLSAALKGNTSLEKGLVTGVLPVAKANLFSGLNNFVEYGISDGEFASYYGFTQEEVDELLRSYNVDQNLAQDIKAWYNGYNVFDIQIYNTWSMVKCLNKFQYFKKNQNIKNVETIKNSILQSYWEKSGNVEFFNKLFKIPIIKNKVDTLVQDKPLIFTLEKQISAYDYAVLKQLLDLGSNYEVNEASADLLFSYLFLSGYLTSHALGGFVLPNQELKNEMKNKLLVYYKQTYSINTDYFTNVTDQLQKLLDSENKLEADKAIESFKYALAELLATFPKFGKIGDENIGEQRQEKILHGNESLIHSVMSYITLQLKSVCIFGTEVHLGKGRADIMFIDSKKKKAAIIEFKYNKESQEAVSQIKDKDYAQKLIKEFDTFLIGINVFADKNVDMACELVRSH